MVWIWVLFFGGLMIVSAPQANAQPHPAADSKRNFMTNPAFRADKDYQEYLAFFEEVYATMEKNYYQPVPREAFDRFLKTFDSKIYGELKHSGKSSSFIKWRSAAYLVEALKSSEDIFSAFMPPKAARTYEQEALGKRIDLGIEGDLVDEGYRISRLEPRADAFEKGLREGDVIQKIDEDNIPALTLAQIQERLNPLENTRVRLEYRDRAGRTTRTIEVISKEYFKQTVFMVPTHVEGIYCLQIQRFNRKTSEDMTRFMSHILKQGDTGLIIDLRGNPGGPPLAAREISSFFLTPEEEFAYFEGKNKPKTSLDVPRIPDQFHYKGDMVILVNEKSGSASELFSGVLQWRGRAVLMGVNTAGQVLLKSMFNFDDESMLLLVTARGHRPDGGVFSFKGLQPDIVKNEEDDDLIRHAAEYLAARKGRNAEKTF